MSYMFSKTSYSVVDTVVEDLSYVVGCGVAIIIDVYCTSMYGMKFYRWRV